jgi:hypothetical protein
VTVYFLVLLYCSLHDDFAAVIEAASCNDGQLDRKGCSGALLDLLAEVASQTLHSDPSVKMSPIKRQGKTAADLSHHLSNKKKV